MAQPGLQLQGRHGSVNLGIGADGRPALDTSGRHGRVNIQGALSSRDWNNASLTRGAQGELILADPNHGTVTMERGPSGSTYIQTRDGNFRVDNSLLHQMIHGQEPLQLQMQPKI